MTALARSKSDQLETMVKKSPSRSTLSEAECGTSLTRKSSSGKLKSISPGHMNTHIKKQRSGQLKLDFDEVSSNTALSRGSSASFGLSFSFAGFTVPPEEIANLRGFSDDDTRKLSYYPTHLPCCFLKKESRVILITKCGCGPTLIG